MPRRPRIHLDGMPLHIVQRGHNREPCFFGEEDYQTYLYWLGKALKQEHCALHAYALMTNHVHLLITPQQADAVPRLIIALGRRYVQYINTTYRRSGTLWDGRFRASVVEPGAHLLACLRYIEQNPVRAGLAVAEYAPNAVKKTVVGVGHADKGQVDHMVKVQLPGVKIAGPDAADALAIAICHAHHLQSAGRLQAAMKRAAG